MEFDKERKYTNVIFSICDLTVLAFFLRKLKYENCENISYELVRMVSVRH